MADAIINNPEDKSHTHRGINMSKGTKLNNIIESLNKIGRCSFSGDDGILPADLISEFSLKEISRCDFEGSDSYPGHIDREYIATDGSLFRISGVMDQPGNYDVELNRPAGKSVKREGVSLSGSSYSLELVFDEDVQSDEPAAVIKGWFGPNSELAMEIRNNGENPEQNRFSLSIKRRLGFKESRYLSMIDGSGSAGGNPVDLLPSELRGQVSLTISGN